MSDSDNRDPNELLKTHEAVVDQSIEGPDAEPKLHLDVKIDTRSACERHITVTIDREDIDLYFDKEFSDLMPAAQVPGFRPGHAPRKLVEQRFRKDVAERVKANLLMDSLAQIHDEQDLSAISEPDVDLDAVEIPDEGPLTFEFDLEVRPSFELPKWKGLAIDKPTREFDKEDIDRTLTKLLANRGRLVPHDGAAELGDYVTTNLTFKQGDKVLSSANEEIIRLRPTLSFRDGKIENFAQSMTGIRAGETRELEAQLTEDAPNVALRGQKLTAVFNVLEVKKLDLPELNAELLDELGGFELEADLRDAIQDTLKRRLEYKQRQEAREQITAALIVAADWELPPDMLRRQSQRELQRAILELRSAGFPDDEILAHENVLRQNSAASTARALKEHFILERIAEDEGIDADEADYDSEIALIAHQSEESPRRVRARLEKAGAMDVLPQPDHRAQGGRPDSGNAQFHEVPYETEADDVAALELTAGGGDDSDIPEAKAGGVEATRGGKPEETRHRG